MAELKTKATKASVQGLLAKISDEKRRKDCQTLVKMFEDITKAKATVWGTAIVGFGQYHYVSDSGREGDWFLTGFASRKKDLTIYTVGGLDQSAELLPKLGKYKRSGSCLYFKSLDNVDLGVLRKIVTRAVKRLTSKK